MLLLLELGGNFVVEIIVVSLLLLLLESSEGEYIFVDILERGGDTIHVVPLPLILVLLEINAYYYRDNRNGWRFCRNSAFVFDIGILRIVQVR